MIALDELKRLTADLSFRAATQQVFFEAMNAGYAADSKPKKSSIADLPGSKVIPFVSGPWTVIDVYQVTPLSSFSGGTTHIWYEGVEVWMMQYFGWYYEEAIPCLKAALRESYEKKEFRGGRGPEFWKSKSPVLHYENELNVFEDTFQWFRGKESIETAGGATMGVHHYQGGLMTP